MGLKPESSLGPPDIIPDPVSLRPRCFEDCRWGLPVDPVWLRQNSVTTEAGAGLGVTGLLRGPCSRTARNTCFTLRLFSILVWHTRAAHCAWSWRG